MIDHILLIYSTVRGYLGCLYFGLLWIMLLQTLTYNFLCGYSFPRGGIAGCTVILWLPIWRASRLFLILATPFYVPTTSLSTFIFLFKNYFKKRKQNTHAHTHAHMCMYTHTHINKIKSSSALLGRERYTCLTGISPWLMLLSNFFCTSGLVGFCISFSLCTLV